MPEYTKDKANDRRANKILTDKIRAQLDDLNAKHRTGTGGSRTEHTEVRNKVNALLGYLSEDNQDYTIQDKLTKLEEAKTAADTYYSLKTHGEEDHQFRTRMGERRANAAKTLSEIFDKALRSVREQLDERSKMQQVYNDIKADQEQKKQQWQQKQQEIKEHVDDLTAQLKKCQKDLDKNIKDMAGKENGSEGLRKAFSDNCRKILAFNMAYPDPETNKREDMLTYNAGGQEKQISREDYRKGLTRVLENDPAYKSFKESLRTSKDIEDIGSKAIKNNGKELIDVYNKHREAVLNENLVKESVRVMKQEERREQEKQAAALVAPGKK